MNHAHFGGLFPTGISFVVKQGNTTQTISIKYAQLANLPPAKSGTDDKSVIPTFLEQTSQGLLLTLYANVPEKSLSMGIEAVSPESLIVYIKGQQIAYNILSAPNTENIYAHGAVIIYSLSCHRKGHVLSSAKSGLTKFTAFQNVPPGI